MKKKMIKYNEESFILYDFYNKPFFALQRTIFQNGHQLTNSDFVLRFEYRAFNYMIKYNTV